MVFTEFKIIGGCITQESHRDKIIALSEKVVKVSQVRQKVRLI